MISFEPFWKQMKKKNITIYALENEYNLNPAEIQRLKKGHNFTISSINRFCQIFQCKIVEIVTFVPDEVENKE